MSKPIRDSSEWKSNTLAQLCDFSSGLWKGKQPPYRTVAVIRNTNFNANGTLNDSDIAYLDVEVRQFAKRALRFGDTVLEKSGGGPKQPVGRVIQFDKPEGEYSFSNFTACVRSKNPEVLSPDYLHRYLYWLYASGVTERIQSHSTGIRNLNLTAYKALKISYPAIHVQKRIVAILDEAFEGIASATVNVQENLQSVGTLFENLLNFAIQGKLVTPNTSDASTEELINQIQVARHEAIVRGKAKPQKTSPIEMIDGERPELPSGWKWAQLESLTSGISDGVHKKPQYVSAGIPFVTVKNLTAGPGISFENLNYVTREDHNEFIKRTHPENGDILISKDGTIGVVRLVETDIEFSIFVSVALIKPVMKQLAPYLVYALRASCVQSQIVPQGTALKHLYLVDLRRLSIPLPSLSEQNLIVSRLNALHEETQLLESAYKRKLVALEALKQSLLDHAFSGNL